MHSVPEMQIKLALSIFFGTFIYEDGATLLAAMLATHGGLDPRIGILTTFLGIWVGDMGLYGLGRGFGRRTTKFRWVQKHLRPESLAKAEAWFAKRGWQALVLARTIPGSRLPLYVAAGALRLPFWVFAWTTAICSTVWVSAIFAIWWFIPMPSFGQGKWLPWVLAALVLFTPWLLAKSIASLVRWKRGRKILQATTR